MDRLKLRRVDNAVVVTIPVEVLDRYGLKEGDDVIMGQEETGIVLTPSPSRSANRLDVARRIMDENATALARLAE